MIPIRHYLDEARDLLPGAVALRRKIHAQPELGLDLPQTAQAVMDGLQGLDVQIARGPSTSGMIVSLTGTKPGAQKGRTVLLRADMDALAMPEDTGLPFASKVQGRMHACGHDAHTAMLVQAVHLLHRHRHELPGTVKFMFQPGEEGWAGARRMIEDGLLDAEPRPNAAFALHVFPDFKAGTFVGRAGPMMASADYWCITIKGKGGHASAPSTTIDPIPVAFEIGLALNAMVTRRIDVFDPVVLTCAKVTAGTTNNVIPETAELIGTLRSTSEAARDTALKGLERVATHVAAAHLCEVEIVRRQGYPVTVNHGGFVDLARNAATDLAGSAAFVERKAPLMGAEDFSYVLQRMPGCMFFLGVRPESHVEGTMVASCHSNKMLLNEDAMAAGIAMHAAVAHRYLEHGLAE
jgi:hippurate hydrolase